MSSMFDCRRSTGYRYDNRQSPIKQLHVCWTRRRDSVKLRDTAVAWQHCVGPSAASAYMYILTAQLLYYFYNKLDDDAGTDDRRWTNVFDVT